MGGPLPIAVSEILAYCQFLGIEDLDERADLMQLIQALDEVYLAEKLKKK